jgi:hypothetical protein
LLTQDAGFFFKVSKGPGLLIGAPARSARFVGYAALKPPDAPKVVVVLEGEFVALPVAGPVLP